MSEPFVGEIRMFAGNFAPRGWAFCDGQLLPVSNNDALFSLLGTIYGGDGRTTFGLPDLRGRVPIHAGQGPGLTARRLGTKGGVETVALSTAQMATHSHDINVSRDAGNESSAAGHYLAEDPNVLIYKETTPDSQMANNIVEPLGGSQPHENRMPYLAVYFIIALVGIYPSRH